MVSPFVKSPLGGNLGLRTGSFFRLDPTGTVPIEPIGDIIPALGGDRITIDALDSEEKSSTYLVTTNALQDFTTAQSNCHKEPIRVSVSGILISSIDLGLVGSTGLGGLPGIGGGLRADLLKIDNLERLAERREPIMYASPRISLAKAFIESVTRSWDPDLGDNTIVSVSLIEARIVNPLIADSAKPDVEASLTGNNKDVPAGAQGGTPVETQSIQNALVQGVAPGVIGAPPL